MLSTNYETSTKVLEPFGLQVNGTSKSDLLTLSIKDLVLKHRLLLFRGLTPMSGADFLELIANIAGGLSNLLRWDFGYLMEVKEDPTKENYLFSKEAVPMHWDGAFHISPFILAFQCVETASSGGATIFSDSTSLWRTASKEEQLEWSKLKLKIKTEKKVHYGGEVSVDMIDRHPVSHETVMRFAERVTSARNPVDVEIHGPSTRDWLKILPERLYNPDHTLIHEWQVGDILFADNHALLHGREAFTADTFGRRCLQRVQIQR